MRARRYGVPILATSVAVVQMTCATFGHLTPWKGGGFGMFAAIDGPGTRVLAISVFDESGVEQRVLLGGGTDAGPLSSRFRGRARAFPSEGRLRRIADAVLSSHLVAQPERPDAPRPLERHMAGQLLRAMQAARPTLEFAGVSPLHLASGRRAIVVTTAVLRLEFDPATMTLELRPVTQVTVRRKEGILTP